MASADGGSRFLEPPGRDRVGFLKELCLLFLCGVDAAPLQRWRKASSEMKNGRGGKLVSPATQAKEAHRSSTRAQVKRCSSMINNSQGDSEELQ